MIYNLRGFGYNERIVKDCSVKIVTRTDGKESVLCTKGVFLCEDGTVTVRYRQEGDEVCLVADSAHLTMERAPRLEMSFYPDRETAARLSFMSSQGDFNVYTFYYSFSFSEERGEGRVKLGYELRFPSAFQKFFLNISIRIISEVK